MRKDSMAMTAITVMAFQTILAFFEANFMLKI